MNTPGKNMDDLAFQRNMMTSFIQIAALAILVTFSVQIIGPFTGLVIWGVVLSVAIYPLHTWVVSKLGGSGKRSAILITLLGLALLIGPAWIAAASVVDSIAGLVSEIRAGTATVPTPSPEVAEWPLIGERVYDTWLTAATDISATLSQFEPQITQLAERMMRAAAGLGLGVLQFAVSIIIAGVCLLFADDGYRLTSSVSRRISAERGQIWADLSISTIRSVTNGVLGVAVIQGVMAGIGFFAFGVPHAGLLAAVVLVTAVIQIPGLLVMGPIAAWGFSMYDGVTATLFLVFCAFVAFSDNFFKPILLGRGVDLPALVVLIGALGGMIRFGVIGLFLGAVILGLSYTIIMDWIRHPGDQPPPVEDAAAS